MGVPKVGSPFLGGGPNANHIIMIGINVGPVHVWKPR